jgi:hypothetical protein
MEEIELAGIRDGRGRDCLVMATDLGVVSVAGSFATGSRAIALVALVTWVGEK